MNKRQNKGGLKLWRKFKYSFANIYIFSICCALIQNEITVLNKCNFDSDMKYFFGSDVINEELYLNIYDDEIIKPICELRIEIKD